MNRKDSVGLPASTPAADPDADPVDHLHLHDSTAGFSKLSSGLVTALVEACSVCLDERGHAPGVAMKVDGYVARSFHLSWPRSNEAMQRSFDDPEVATEHAAYCVACALIVHISEYSVVRRARKKTGFDWWLTQDSELPFTDAARLEVSGIRSGKERDIASRLRAKEFQTMQSDDTGLPAFALVVEFGHPWTRVAKR